MSADEPESSPWSDRGGKILILLLGAMYCWNLGRVELSVTDEARSGVIVRDMVQGGHWLLPRTPDGYLSEKPPVYYGLSALLGGVLGINEWTLRAVSVAMGCGTLVLTWVLARLYGPPRAAALAAIALASNILFMGAARTALVDMTLAFFLTGGLAAYFAGRVGRLSPWRAAGLCGLAFGLATLSKGPLGLAFPMAVVAGDVLVEHRGRFWRSLVWWKQGLAAVGVALALAGTWYAAGYLRAGNEFLETCLISENLRMPLGDPRGIGVSHGKAPFYYLGIQAVVMLATAPLLPAVVGWAKRPDSGPALRHLAVWIGFGFLLFELPVNKRMYYLLPLQPAVAVLIGLAADGAVADGRWLKASVGSFGALVLAGAVGLAAVCVRPGWIAGIREGSVEEALIRHRGWVLAFDAGLGALAILLIRSARQGPEAALRGVCLLAVYSLAVRFGVGDRLESEFDRTRPFIRAVTPALPAGEIPVVLPPIRGYSLDFYWPGPLVRNEAAALKARHVLVARQGLSRIPAPYSTLGTWKYGANGRDDILLVRRDAAR